MVEDAERGKIPASTSVIYNGCTVRSGRLNVLMQIGTEPALPYASFPMGGQTRVTVRGLSGAAGGYRITRTWSNRGVRGRGGFVLNLTRLKPGRYRASAVFTGDEFRKRSPAARKAFTVRRDRKPVLCGGFAPRSPRPR